MTLNTNPNTFEYKTKTVQDTNNNTTYKPTINLPSTDTLNTINTTTPTNNNNNETTPTRSDSDKTSKHKCHETTPPKNTTTK